MTSSLTQHSHCWCYIMIFFAKRELRDIDWRLVRCWLPLSKAKRQIKGRKTSLQLAQHHNRNHQLQEELCHLQRGVSALLLEGQCWKMRGSTEGQSYPLKLLHNKLELTVPTEIFFSVYWVPLPSSLAQQLWLCKAEAEQLHLQGHFNQPTFWPLPSLPGKSNKPQLQINEKTPAGIATSIHPSSDLPRYQTVPDHLVLYVNVSRSHPWASFLSVGANTHKCAAPGW